MISEIKISITELVTWAELHPANKRVTGTDSPSMFVRFLRSSAATASSKHVPFGKPFSCPVLGLRNAKANSSVRPTLGAHVAILHLEVEVFPFWHTWTANKATSTPVAPTCNLRPNAARISACAKFAKSYS